MFRSVHLLPVLGTLLLSGCYSEMFVVFPQWDVQLTNWSGAVFADTPEPPGRLPERRGRAHFSRRTA